MKRPAFGDDELCALQRNTFDYFWKETNPENGLLADNTSGDAPASIAAVGHALAAYVVGVENSYVTRPDSIARTLTTLRFFRDSPQSKEPDATGYKGFYYHFLDMQTGRRVWQCELSTIDTMILLAGALTLPHTLTARQTMSARFVNSPTRSTAVLTGSGRRTARRQSHTAGSRSAAF
jgi:hypothetical protein